MAIRTIFEDDNNNEMNCYLNDKGQVYINISAKDFDAPYDGNFITLDKSDVQELIKMLTELESSMDE
ncbi:hypothetical protein VRU48_08045 [Pedobacter sp. KR3-3]|uniref:Uncharacterized protein n=1 Tax=Pedobacter albus TaxID=3113905 RepID=A0ABU7I745_9SPHI|nr:hypothetical protein [Pedobacter sp. KR3-3]MEE1945054.1 hypothetical protein [Pedobacter sp. KR3-3]